MPDQISLELALVGGIAAIAWGAVCFLVGRLTAPPRIERHYPECDVMDLGKASDPHTRNP